MKTGEVHERSRKVQETARVTDSGHAFYTIQESGLRLLKVHPLARGRLTSVSIGVDAVMGPFCWQCAPAFSEPGLPVGITITVATADMVEGAAIALEFERIT